MRNLHTLVIILLLSAGAGLHAQEYIPSPENLKAREEYKDCRFGIFIHWGIYSMLGDGEWVMNLQNISYDEYSRLAAGFYPSKYDAHEWAKLFKDAGAKYVTITSRHHDGFSMFDTQASDYNIVKATPYAHDVLKDLSEALAEEGLKLSFYYSHLDWGRSDYWPLGSTGHGTGRPEGDSDDWGHYIEFMKAQLTELLTNYGPIAAIWFDGVWDKVDSSKEWLPQLDQWRLPEQYDLIHRLQPSCLVINNHHNSPIYGEDAQTFERDVPGENKMGYSSGQQVSETAILETSYTLNDSWGFDIHDQNFKSVKEMVTVLARTASKGANLLLNVGPRPDGTIPEGSVKILLGIGEWLKANGEAIYETEKGCIPEQEWGVTTQNGNKLYIHVLNPTSTVELPLTRKANQLLSARILADGTPVQFSQTKSGLTLNLPTIEKDSLDTVIELTFKNML